MRRGEAFASLMCVRGFVLVDHRVIIIFKRKALLSLVGQFVVLNFIKRDI